MSFSKKINRIPAHAWGIFLLVIVTVVALDQASKQFIIAYFSAGVVKAVIPDFFNIGLTYNRGAAFGFLSGLSDGPRQIVLGLTTTLALAVVLYFLLYEYFNDRVGQFALAMIVGGALGNIIDRFRHGMVVDFLDFYLKNYHWPAFNLADSSICIAVCLLLFHRPKKGSRDTQKE